MRHGICSALGNVDLQLGRTISDYKKFVVGVQVTPGKLRPICLK